MICDYDSVVGVILWMIKYCLLYSTPHIEIDNNTPTFLHFCQKHSVCVFASGKNGSTPILRDKTMDEIIDILLIYLLASTTP